MGDTRETPKLAKYAGTGLTLITIALGAVGVGLTMFGETVLVQCAGILCHPVAIVPAYFAARRRRGGPLAPAERDVTLLSALFLPFIGPALSIGLPRKLGGGAVENSHEAMERYKNHVKPSIPDYERSLFTGDYDRDLARKLDLETYRDVLRHGGTDQKRSALFRLAELAQPHHLALIRSCLEDDDQEVRLYAYGELDRLMKGHEEAVSNGRERVADDPQDPEAHLELARAHFDLARSGVLDRATSGFHLKVAAECAGSTIELDSNCIEAATLMARSYARTGEFVQACECIESLPSEMRILPETHLAMAEIAFEERDFTRAREEALQLATLGVELPGWLEALLDEAPEQAEDAVDADESDATEVQVWQE